MSKGERSVCKDGKGREFSAKAVVLATGTFMEGKIYIGEYESPDGRLGERAALGLGPALAKGFTVGRLKTGTPMRILRRSFDPSLTEEQEADEIMRPFLCKCRNTQTLCQVLHHPHKQRNPRYNKGEPSQGSPFRVRSRVREPATALPSKIRLKVPRT